MDDTSKSTDKNPVKVSVFWDIESCPVPAGLKGAEVVSSIKKLATGEGNFKNFIVFGDLNNLSSKLKEDLSECSVSLQDVKSKKPNACDISILVEILKITCDYKPPYKIILISGDKEFFDVFNVLVFRGYEVILIHSSSASEPLVRSASKSMEWKAFLGVLKPSPILRLSAPYYSHHPNDNPMWSGEKFEEYEEEEEGEFDDELLNSHFIDSIDENNDNSNNADQMRSRFFESEVNHYEKLFNNDENFSRWNEDDIFSLNGLQTNGNPNNTGNSNDYDSSEEIFNHINELHQKQQQQILIDSPESSFQNPPLQPPMIPQNPNYIPPNLNSQPLRPDAILPHFIPLIETLQSLSRPERPQVLLSMIGGRCGWKKAGYSKLRDYVIDAARYGYCIFGGEAPQEWAAIPAELYNINLSNNSPSSYPNYPAVTSMAKPLTNNLSSKSSQSEVRALLALLPAALNQLKKQYFKPTETAIKGALKSLQRQRVNKITLTPQLWEDLIAAAIEANCIIEGTAPKRVIYLPDDRFEGADPDHPQTQFSDEIWDTLQKFLIENRPGKKNGRFGFAECLSCKGPQLIRQLPLGTICELVQQALMRSILEFHKGFVGVPESYLSDSLSNTTSNGTGNNSNNNSSPSSPSLTSMKSNILLDSINDINDENTNIIFELLPKSLESLEKDMLKPYEQVVQARIRQLAGERKLSFKKKHWNSVLVISSQRNYKIIDTEAGRLIYCPSEKGIFCGVDPRHPQSRFESYVWDALQSFLVSIHPMCYPLRYQFAAFLKQEGPTQIKGLPLGIISELVESAISRGYLRRLDPKTIATTDFIPSYNTPYDSNDSPPHSQSAPSTPNSSNKNANTIDPIALIVSICQTYLPQWPLPVYVVIDCNGPPHAPTYSIAAVLGEYIIGTGEGPSKFEGHQSAAWNSLNVNSSIFFDLLFTVLSPRSFQSLTTFLRDNSIFLGKSVKTISPVPEPPAESSCDWHSISLIIRSLSDQPTQDKVLLALSEAEKYLKKKIIVAIPGLLNSIVKNVHLHYLRDTNSNFVKRLAEIAFAVDNWVDNSQVMDRYPALPELNFKILFSAGESQLVWVILLRYMYAGTLHKCSDLLAVSLSYAYPTPSSFILDICKNQARNDEEISILSILFHAFANIEYTITSHEIEIAKSILMEWISHNSWTEEIRGWFAHIFRVFIPSSAQPSLMNNINNNYGQNYNAMNNNNNINISNIQNNNRSYFDSGLSPFNLRYNQLQQKLKHKKLCSVKMTWKYGGSIIKLAGSFNDWTEFIPLTPGIDDNIPQLVLNLPEGVHQYKFIVDGEWMCDPEAPLLIEPLSGYKNNYIEIKDSYLN